VAVVRLGSVVADIRGSIGDETYGRNQGGIFIRERVTPANPNTQPQQDSRAAITTLAQAWSGALTDAQRASWRAYAHAHPQPDRFGQVHLVNGYCRFIRANYHRTRILGGVAFAAAPPEPDLYPPLFSYTISGAGDFTWQGLPPDNYDPPWNDLRLWVYIGIPVTPGTAFFNGPWQYLGTNLYNGAWAEDPWFCTYPWDIDPGEKCFAKMIAQHDSEGHISTPGRATAIAT